MGALGDPCQYDVRLGRVVESGTWDTLIGEQAGRFHELCRAQGFVARPPPAARSDAGAQTSTVDG